MKVTQFFISSFMLGQYLGDVWEYDFTTMSYTNMNLEGPDMGQLSRSNHTAVFYPAHNS